MSDRPPELWGRGRRPTRVNSGWAWESTS